jgi:hypothetical protein
LLITRRGFGHSDLITFSDRDLDLHLRRESYPQQNRLTLLWQAIFRPLSESGYSFLIAGLNRALRHLALDACVIYHKPAAVKV